MRTLFKASQNMYVTYELESNGRLYFNFKHDGSTEDTILVSRDDINTIGYGLDYNALIYKESRLCILIIKDSVLIIKEKGKDGKLLYAARLEDEEAKDIKALCTAVMIVSISSAKDKFDDMF